LSNFLGGQKVAGVRGGTPTFLPLKEKEEFILSDKTRL
jgi:hypothetical protein